MKWTSPRSPGGALLTAVVIHGLAYGLIVLGLGPAQKVVPTFLAEVGYEILDDVPPPAAVAQHPVRMRESEMPTPVKAEPVDSPKELQSDEKDAVTGTQSSYKTSAAVGSETEGTAPSTPFYKVKPKYPRAALVAGTEGWVLLKVDVNEKGEVENVRVVDGQQRIRAVLDYVQNNFPLSGNDVASRWRGLKFEELSTDDGKTIFGYKFVVRIQR